MGGCLTLIKSGLSSIPIYFLSFIKCPKSVAQCLEKIQCDFLWNDTTDKKNYHLVKWELVNQFLVEVWAFSLLRK